MFSERIERALRTAQEAHAGQTRKGLGAVPYVTHPVHVAILLARLGADDVAITAGLLHDVVEDCEGWTDARVELEFGPEVAAIVRELTEDKSRSWRERKLDGIERVKHMSVAAATVKAADKLHNLRALVADLRSGAPASAVWARFNGGRDRTLELSTQLVNELVERVDPRLGRELRAAIEELHELPGG
ncbi:MAG: bifunctional (p)ppGpp synthetase/guanosine-3',5'-bis(diphosphate) 3'-pyrophosphohydrolase [Planctomycetes bacterium]|nr:bifunctional (p)ppGpp synthetase/guanosine-3',5'-bis(diphosphate) 3'-pyrophosphohydrolase [Planctomycetota bacterium]